jgi:hypothetical protein
LELIEKLRVLKKGVYDLSIDLPPNHLTPSDAIFTANKNFIFLIEVNYLVGSNNSLEIVIEAIRTSISNLKTPEQTSNGSCAVYNAAFITLMPNN